MRMAYVPIIMEGSVGSGESTGLGFRKPPAHPPVVCGLQCDLEQSAKSLWSQIPSLG